MTKDSRRSILQHKPYTHKLTEGESSGFQNFIKFTFDRKVAAVESSLLGIAVILIFRDKSGQVANTDQTMCKDERYFLYTTTSTIVLHVQVHCTRTNIFWECGSCARCVCRRRCARSHIFVSATSRNPKPSLSIFQVPLRTPLCLPVYLNTTLYCIVDLLVQVFSSCDSSLMAGQKSKNTTGTSNTFLTIYGCFFFSWHITGQHQHRTWKAYN